MAKHFDLDTQDAAVAFSVNEKRVAAEAALDGLYVIRTSVAEAKMSAEAAVLNYKRLAEVERVFRTLKGVDPRFRGDRPARASDPPSAGELRQGPHLSQHVTSCLLRIISNSICVCH